MLTIAIDRSVAHLVIPAENGLRSNREVLMLNRSQAIPVRLVTWALLLLVALVAPGAVARAESEASHVQPIRTSKERLRVKASDEQRVDGRKIRVRERD